MKEEMDSVNGNEETNRNQSGETRGAGDGPESPLTFETILARYESKLGEQQEIVRQRVARWGQMGYFRGGLFLLSVLLLGLGLASYLEFRVLWFVLSGLTFAGFLFVAFVHEGMQQELRIARLKSEMIRESIARLKRQWKEIPDQKLELPSSILPTSLDLDLFGSSSLFKLIGVCRTPRGIETLRDWVVLGALPDEVKRRQEAVAELAADRNWVDKFRLCCEQLALSKSGPAKFVEWCESPDWFARRGWVLWFARITSLMALAGFVIMGTGIISPVIGVLAIVAAFLLNFTMAVIFSGGIHDAFNMVSSRSTDIYHYVSLFEQVAQFEANSKKLKGIQTRLFGIEHDVRKNIGSLSQLIWMANLRRHGILFLVYLLVEFLFFWDVHVLHRLEAWKKEHGHKSREWFDDLGTWEALTALGVFAADQPGWIFPDVEFSQPGQGRIEAVEMAHPMLGEERVANSVNVGPAGTVLLVSGSNMSGKSTLLRTIGINSVLAQMGSVVCAKEFRMPPLYIETSMKIVDSMADGISFFMAELKRLKEIVDQARSFRGEERTMLFLLDEILQGTNSRERQIAVSRVVRKLIDDEAIGAISTHDLDLATTEELKEACQSVHFTEEFFVRDGQRHMTFDYKMRHGIAETTNALKLLEMVGLGDD